MEPKVKVQRISELTPDDHNANRGTERGSGMLEDSLRQYGAGRSILIDKNGKVIAGNKTVETAAQAGFERVIVVPSDGKTLVAVQRTDLDLDKDKQAKELAIADNRVGQVSLDWDPEVLADLSAEIDLEKFWKPEELAELLDGFEDGNGGAGASDGEPAPEPQINRAAELREKWQTAKGQIWEIPSAVGKGNHRMICGDSSTGDLFTLMGSARANVVFTSPPYAEQRQYDEASGFRPIHPDDYVRWYEPLARNLRQVLADDGSYFLNIKPSCEGLDTFLYVFDLVIAHAREWDFHFATEFCWERNGVPKSVTQRFKNQFEPVYQFALNRWKMRPEAVRHESANVPVAGGPGSGNTSWGENQGGIGAKSVSGSFGAAKKRRNGTSSFMADVQGHNAAPGEYIGPGLAYPGNRLPTFAGTHEAWGHAAAFPVGLPAFFINAYSDIGDIILDPFMGSASTIVAAEQNGRLGFGCELSPDYLAVCLERMQQMGLEPRLCS